MDMIPHRSRGKCGIPDVKRRFSLAKPQLRLKIEDPALTQSKSADGSLPRVSQMCHWLRPFLDGLYVFFENEKVMRETGSK